MWFLNDLYLGSFKYVIIQQKNGSKKKTEGDLAYIETQPSNKKFELCV